MIFKTHVEEVLEFLETQKDWTDAIEIGKHVSLSEPRTVYRYLRRLVKDGKVEKKQINNARNLYRVVSPW
jgi:Fe2+ or Zn2+ uptake regulation protein